MYVSYLVAEQPTKADKDYRFTLSKDMYSVWEKDLSRREAFKVARARKAERPSFKVEVWREVTCVEVVKTL